MASQLSEQRKEAQRAYLREWRARNKDKVREANRRYWERKGAEINAARRKGEKNVKTSVKIIANPKSEAQHQANVIAWSLLHREEFPELALLHHIPNGGRRDAIEARHLKEQGVKAGVPDLCLPVPQGRYHGLYIEMKAEEGHTGPAQEWWGERLTEQGYFWKVCHGWEAAVSLLEWYLGGAGHG